MATPTGDWTINANGWHGTLSLEDDGGGNVSGKITFDGASLDSVKGIWNDTAQQLVFLHTFSDGHGNSIVQDYTGYYFENTGQIFAPSGTPNWRMLAENFDDVAWGSQRPRFGWVARQAV